VLNPPAVWRTTYRAGPGFPDPGPSAWYREGAHDLARLAGTLPGQARRVAGRAVGGRRGGQGRAQDLRVPWRRDGRLDRPEVRSDQGSSQRMAVALSAGRLGYGLHWPIRLEQPADRRRDPRRGAARSRRRVLPDSGQQAAQEG